MDLCPRPARALLAAVALVALSAAPALADPAASTLSAPTAVQRSDCPTTRLTGQPGVATTQFTAPAASTLDVALAGPATSDWDLAVFDHATGRRLGGSGAWGSTETVTALVRGGQSVDVQACRVSGPARSVALSIRALALPAVPGVTAAGHPRMVHIDLPSPAAFGLLQQLGVNVDEDASAAGVSAVIDDPAQLAKVERAGFRVRTTIPDLVAFDRQQRRDEAANTARLRAAGGSALPSGRTQYRHLEEFQADLKSLVQRFPAIVRPITLPHRTFKGREQMGVEISSDVARTDDQKPVSFVMGIHHAREWPAGEIAMEFATHLAQQFGTDPEITDLLRRARVVVVPVINPDGFVASREAPDPADSSGDPAGAPSLAESVGAGGSLAYRRKNCNGPGAQPQAPCDVNTGVDPNRNYGFGWGGPGASSSPNSQTYRGSGPWSEAETQSVHEFSQVHDVTSLMTLHTFASLVLRPPGLHDAGLAPDEPALKALGDAMGADTGYTSQYSYQLYDTSGTTEDWNYGAAGTYGYTIELGPESGDGGNFHISYQRAVIDQWLGTGEREGRGMRRALLRITEAAATRPDFSSLIGRAPAGRVLRLKKTFKTSTSRICQVATPTDVDPVGILNGAVGGALGGSATTCANAGDPQLVDDKLEYTTRVPANGVFSWLVTPSTRPFEFKAGHREAWTLTCEDDAGRVLDLRQVTIWRGEVQAFEMPCGGTLPGGVKVTTQAQADALALTDRIPPTSRMARRGVRASRARVALRGSATDTAPAGLQPRVAKVRVAIGRRFGSKCRYLDAQGRFGPLTSCKRTSYVVARVARAARSVRWSYTLGAKLPPGRYLAWSRGIDAAGNVERKARKRNLVRFTIR